MINESEGFTTAEAEEIGKKIESIGWKVEINNLDAVKHDDSVWWYEYDSGAPILSVENKDGTIAYVLIADGDINITDPKDEENHFYFEGGKPDTGEAGELTEDLINRGVWGNNNWFEIIREVYSNDTYDYEVDSEFGENNDTVEAYLKEAVNKLINLIKEDKG